jgi:hypothetical protein
MHIHVPAAVHCYDAETIAAKSNGTIRGQYRARQNKPRRSGPDHDRNNSGNVAPGTATVMRYIWCARGRGSNGAEACLPAVRIVPRFSKAWHQLPRVLPQRLLRPENGNIDDYVPPSDGHPSRLGDLVEQLHPTVGLAGRAISVVARIFAIAVRQFNLYFVATFKHRVA